MGFWSRWKKCVFHAQVCPLFRIHHFRLREVRHGSQKIQAVVRLAKPQIPARAMQRFLGFANFYRRFIRNYSQLAAPLTALTSTNKCSGGLKQPNAAFSNSRAALVQLPFLLPMIPPVSCGGGGSTHQRWGWARFSPSVLFSDEKIQSCTFFSHRLSPAERNYDIGNRELLAV